MIVSSCINNKRLGVALLLVILVIFGAACSSGASLEAGDYLPSSRQLRGDYIRSGETTEFEFSNPPISAIKREYVTSKDYPDDYQFYLLVQVYEDVDTAGFQYFEMVKQLRVNTSPGNPIVIDTEYEKLADVENTILMYQILRSDSGTGRSFVEVWRVFRQGTVVVICESIGYLDLDDPEPGLVKRIDETLYYAEIIRDKVE